MRGAEAPAHRCRRLAVGKLFACVALLAAGSTAACGGTPASGGTLDPAAQPDRPYDVTATAGTLEAVVHVEWRGPTARSADGFVLLRDGVELAEVSATTLRYDDAQAEAGTPGVPSLTTSSSTRTDGVMLTWSVAPAVPGASHRYAVTARFGAVLSVPSDSAVGFRAAPGIVRYDLEREDLGTWQPLTSASSYLDVSAPLGAIDPGSVDARPYIVPLGAVTLVATGASAQPVAAQYRVRAVGPDGPGPASAPVRGARGVGPLTYQWERSSADADGDYAPLPDVTGPSWYDADLPPGAARYYRASLHADGAADAVTAGARAQTEPAIAKVAAAENLSCAIRVDGSVACWGGHGLAPFALGGVPLDAAALQAYSDVAIGDSHACALRAGSGLVHCWGGASLTPPVPADPSTEAFREVASGSHFTCGVRASDGTLACWGEPPTGPGGSFLHVAAAGQSVCAIRAADGKVVCWGGYGVPPPQGPSQDAVTEVSTNYAGGTCAVRATDGRAVCWGSTVDNPPSDPVHGIAVGSDFACALRRADDTPVCWGSSVPDGAGGVTSQRSLGLAIGTRHGCSILVGGKVACFGENGTGEAPWLPRSGRFTSVSGGSVPCATDAGGHVHCWGASAWLLAGTPPGASDVTTAVSSSDPYACALDSQGSPRCWGYSPYDPPSAPLAPPAGALFRALSVADRGGCGIGASTGTLACWGSLGALPADFGSESFTAVGFGGGHLCAIRADSKLRCWGSNAFGQAPAGPSVDSFSAVSTGPAFTCAIGAADQRLRCWGGAALSGSTVDSFIPPTGPSDDRYRAVASGDAHVCAIRSDDGKVVCWGRAYGPTGASVGSYTSLSAAHDGTCGVRAGDGKVICWGAGHFGQSGDPVVLP